ncbi:MAG: M24 family metallopeptidase [Candidatus Eremiobacteraeota bacterium]|nr:M24 family metallopeptidase [Candidatus Eremiobacteraeota bacterium]
MTVLTHIEDIQKTLAEMDLDGWLFCSFRGSDPYASRVLRLEEKGASTRRWFYYLPARREPVKIVHIIEEGQLDALPGEKKIYLSWKELHRSLREALHGARRVAMQYSPMNAIPYVSTVDGGTIELIRSFGVDIVSSADLIQRFESLLTESQLASHREAVEDLRRIVDLTFGEIRRHIAENLTASEYSLQQFVLERFRERSLITHHYPVVAFNEHTANPHYEPLEGSSKALKAGDFILLDIWAKKDAPLAVYGDITWTAFAGTEVPPKYSAVFDIVKRARESALALVEERVTGGRELRGWEIDDRARALIEAAGYGPRFIHRTGHSIGEDVHGTGVNIDNLETQDERLILPGCCFSLEPGIYLEGDFGVRSEIDVYVGNRTVQVFGQPLQQAVVPLMA